MQAGSDFEASDRIAAVNFAQAACEAGVRRIVYLGGLAHGNQLSNAQPVGSRRHPSNRRYASD
jgi:hypothetical protein